MNAEFETAAQNHVAGLVEDLMRLSYQGAADLPRAEFDDIVIAGKEVQLTIFKQEDIRDLPGAILVTAQIVRAALGGVLSFHYEKGLVFEKDKSAREASEEELRMSG